MLRLSVLWTVWVWFVLVRNMVVDHHDSWSFRLLHIGLAIVSLAFAVVLWQLTGRARRFTKTVERNFGFRPPIPERRRRPGAPGAAGPGPGKDDAIVVDAKPAG